MYLKEYVPANCDYGSASQAAINDYWICLCQTESFLEQSAQDIWSYCGCSDLESTANIISSYCADINHPINGAESYVSWGDDGVLPCVEPGTGHSKLSAGDIGGIVGGIVAFLALIVGLVQMAAAVGWIDTKYEPWSQIVEFFCCGTIDPKKHMTPEAKREEQEEKKKERVGIAKSQ
jgi:hypothetical protein